MTAEQERAAVVAYLRELGEAIAALLPEAATSQERGDLSLMAAARLQCADAIERGEHLAQTKGSEP